MSPAFTSQTHTHTRTNARCEAGSLSKQSVSSNTTQIYSSDSRRLFRLVSRGDAAKQRLMPSWEKHQNPRIEVCVCVWVSSRLTQPAAYSTHPPVMYAASRGESESSASGFKRKSSRGENRSCNVTQSYASYGLEEART